MIKYGYYKNADARLASERTENDEAKVPDDNKIWDAGNLGADGQIGDAWWITPGMYGRIR